MQIALFILMPTLRFRPCSPRDDAVDVQQIGLLIPDHYLRSCGIIPKGVGIEVLDQRPPLACLSLAVFT